jgi:subtilase family serine protease
MRRFVASSSFFRLVILAVFVAVFAIAFFPTTALAQTQPQAFLIQRPLITQAVDESRVVKLTGNTHPMARPENDLGTAPATLPMERMLLVLKRSDDQEYALRRLLDDQQDKSSPNYHKWLTPEQFGAQYGPTNADMQTITNWLQSHGFEVGTTKGRTVLEFSGSARCRQPSIPAFINIW